MSVVISRRKTGVCVLCRQLGKGDAYLTMKDCEACRFWGERVRIEDDDNVWARCQRHAPAPRLVDYYEAGPIPELGVTRRVDWCGDFKPREAKK